MANACTSPLRQDWKSKGAAKLSMLDFIPHKKAWDKKLNLPPTRKLKEEAEALTRLVQGVPVSRAMVDEAPLPLRQQSWITEQEQEGTKVKDGEAKHFGEAGAKTEAFTFVAKFESGGGLESIDIDTNVTAEEKIFTKMEKLHNIEKKLALVKAPEYHAVTVLHKSPERKRKEEGAQDRTDRTEGKDDEEKVVEETETKLLVIGTKTKDTEA
ncbi:hypothetical protein G7K_4279-t1 [Saitoella complicata NRRL Y-17804]|uniref:Uncharacterized protein n=1 Tax=Saitoella complicata (strain BCRC 22490 / CBS 7301 / JCM 7358 / NBRC 10748 / NRRL Y-17804) TaxID=698492 RepID=A0A0E9NJX4_SAICN|nr:hypothetical protein G7K_4279-t1 [Saitoella complicata NRRL Y-17804]